MMDEQTKQEIEAQREYNVERAMMFQKEQKEFYLFLLKTVNEHKNLIGKIAGILDNFEKFHEQTDKAIDALNDLLSNADGRLLKLERAKKVNNQKGTKKDG